jgi:hypothetical protein
MIANKKAPRKTAGLLLLNIVMRIVCSVLGRPGSDLLFQALRLSTIGAEDFDGRVRDGIGYRLLAMTTRSAKDGTIAGSNHTGSLSTNMKQAV